MAFLVDFAAIAAIGLLVDRVALSELRRIAETSWPIKSGRYWETLWPRILPLPVGVALSAYGRSPDVDALNLIGLILLLTPVLLLCVRFIRQWYAARPRR